MTPPEKTHGQLLYEKWCGSSESDRARYFMLMSPGDREAWERLAAVVGQPGETWREDPEPIHLWFNLTYANYLVLPRSVLQSMPQPWQARFCTLLDELHELFGGLDWPSYDVRALAREQEFITPYVDCPECGEVGGDADCPTCGGETEIEDPEGPRYETPEEVGFRDDPIPHYNRGRTRLELKP